MSLQGYGCPHEYRGYPPSGGSVFFKHAQELGLDVPGHFTNLIQKHSAFFKIPQIGLTRFYQEKSLQTVDKSNIFQAAVAELIHVLYLPIEKSLQILQQKIAESMDAGDVDENPKTYYNIWIQRKIKKENAWATSCR